MREIEQRLRIIENAPKLQNSSVTNGTTTVLDGSGVTRTRFGLLSDGSYGLEVMNPSGQLVNLANSVFPVTATWTPTQNVTATTPTALPNGPSVSITVGPSGRAMVQCTADIGLNTTGQTAYIGFTNATTGNQLSGWLSVSATVLIAGTAGRPIYLSGLPQGTNTFTATAYVSTGNANFSAATIVAIPY